MRWLDSARGRRATGLGYVGGPSGGVAFGIRNFWQSHPAQLDIRGAASETATVTMWLWAPDAPPMDLRFYHDGMGQDTYEKQLEGPEYHVRGLRAGLRHAARRRAHQRDELWMLPSTPTRERFAAARGSAAHAAVIVARRRPLHEAGVFGDTFSLPDRNATPEHAQHRSSNWTGCSISTSGSASSTAGTASGTTAT